MKLVLFYFTFFVLFGLINTVQAVDLNDGGYYLIDDNRYQEDVFLDFGVVNNPGTHLELTTGSLINGYIVGYNTSRITVTGGAASGLWLTDQATALVNSGDIGDCVIANGSSQIDINGGAITHDVEAKDNSEVQIKGGAISDTIRTFSNGFIYLQGNFSVNGVLLANGESLADYGTFYTDADGDWLTGIVSGRLADGSIISVDFYLMTRTNSGQLTYGDIIVQAQPALTITAPPGGEVYLAGQELTLQWQAPAYIPTVDLSYSLNAGQDWTSIATAAAQTGSYPWTAPAADSQQCRIRIADAEFPGLFDQSDLFTVYICTLKYDLNDDCLVDLSDLMLLSTEWLQSGNPFL